MTSAKAYLLNESDKLKLDDLSSDLQPARGIISRAFFAKKQKSFKQKPEKQHTAGRCIRHFRYSEECVRSHF